MTLGDEGGSAHALVDTLTESPAVVEAVCDARGGSHGLVDTLTETLALVEAVNDTRSDSPALVESLPDTLAEMEERTLRDTRRDAQTLVDRG